MKGEYLIMIHVVTGNLLHSDCDVIMHKVNCFSTMETGLARQIREMYPKAYKKDQEFPCKPEDRLGKFSFAKTLNVFSNKDIIIMNLYGQLNKYGPDKNMVYTDKSALKTAMDLALMYLKDTKVLRPKSKIGLPYMIGCGRGNESRDNILPIIEELSIGHNVDIYLYKFEKQ